jgi:hypothetical protein
MSCLERWGFEDFMHSHVKPVSPTLLIIALAAAG